MELSEWIGNISDTNVSSSIFDEKWPESFLVVIDTHIVSSRSHIHTNKVTGIICDDAHAHILSTCDGEVTSDEL
jgi:hypothetical protein